MFFLGNPVLRSLIFILGLAYRRSTVAVTQACLTSAHLLTEGKADNTLAFSHLFTNRPW